MLSGIIRKMGAVIILPVILLIDAREALRETGEFLFYLLGY
jgi:hypothetical protein